MTTPTAFISYSWDDDDHKAWVKGLAARLIEDGINVVLDIWANSPGNQLTAFMERAISDNDFVLVICTPGYKQRSDERRGGVGYEGDIITSEIFYRGNHEKFIPILRSGTWGDGEPTDAAPAWLRGKVYIDLSADPYSEESYRDLVETLLGTRETAPPIGEPMSTIQPASSRSAACPKMDHSFFERQLKGSVDAAGARYTPKLHVELEIAKQLEAFGRTKDAIDRIKSLAIGIRKRLDLLRHSGSAADPALQEIELGDLLGAGNRILQELGALEARPAGQLPLATIMDSAEAAAALAKAALDTIFDLEQQYWAERKPDDGRRRRRDSPFSRLEGDIYGLRSELRRVHALIGEADKFANSQLLILTGAAGTGKTHLLCDFASNRVATGAPVILLLGQRFTEPAEPWTQVLRLTEMHDKSVDYLITSLEEAAKAADARALLIIDALNEGRGRDIWPNHLPTFLARLEASPRIAVVLSVRTTYEEAVVPEDVRNRAASVTHNGFESHEYEAVQKFFAANGLEFSSAPTLHAEFRNPLFLKTVCEGLRRHGETRLPRGFHGFTSVFDLYLDGVNKELAKSLDYNPRDNLVRAALNSIAEQLAASGRMNLPRRQAESLVNGWLPGQGFSKSLYHGLVTAGVLTEDIGWGSDAWEDVTHIVYERLADHIIAASLLKTHLGTDNPQDAFAEGGGLAFLSEGEQYVPTGLIEALCIQVPEQTGVELARLAPRLMSLPGIGAAFQESVIWRKLDAFTEDTLAVWKELIDSDQIWDDPTDTLLTISTIPDHPFNAEYLDRKLRWDAMPDRDAWWNTYLHETWESEGPVDRLVDWASVVSTEDTIGNDVVDLAAISLAWTLATSNRFLRDRATKALVALLTGRLESAARLVERFADVDDPYVTERVYAVAYGVTLRNHDPTDAGPLASLVYEKVFADGCPPAHVLLRDYARGVIERAIHLGADVTADVSLVRPPYRSTWPYIPDSAAIEDLMAEQRGLGDDTDSAFSVDHIRFSVSSGDFGKYVIGHYGMSDWLALPLADDPWQSPQERIQELLPQLSASERLAWERYDDARMRLQVILQFVDRDGNVSDSIGFSPSLHQTTDDNLPEGDPKAPAGSQDQGNIGDLWNLLMANLTEKHRAELLAILKDRENREVRSWPRFDLELARRYILWRVFDLGWTTERFGKFDRNINRSDRREAAKPERVGKKYQWIGYHEMLAYLADHYQYRPSFTTDESDWQFRGPWQGSLRDIDPSWAFHHSAGSGFKGTDNLPRLTEPTYTVWAEDLSHGEWLAVTEDLPQFAESLRRVELDTGVHWIIVNGSFSWEQPPPADRDRFDTERRRFGFSITGYFVRPNDVDDFRKWLGRTGGLNLEPHADRQIESVFFGEYGWAPAFQYHEQIIRRETRSDLEGDWSRFIEPATVTYNIGISGFDCSELEGNSTLLPHHELIARLGLQWSGKGAEFLDEFGQLAAFATSGRGSEHTALLIREDLVKRYMAQEDLVLCWTVAGTKMTLGGESTMTYRGRLAITGSYEYDGDELHGSVTSEVDLPADADDGGS